jgi:hypothetical protein
MRRTAEFVLNCLSVKRESRAVQQQAIVQGLNHLLELFSEQERTEPSGKRLLDVQERMVTIEEVQDRDRLGRHRHDRVGVVHRVTQAEDVLSLHRGRERLYRT